MGPKLPLARSKLLAPLPHSNDCMLGLQRRPRLVSRPSLFELITRKNIEDLSDLGFVQHHLGLPDLIEDIDDRPYSPGRFISNFPVPIQTVQSTARTIRMPSKESGIGDSDQNGSVFAISGPVVTAENMIGVAMYELVSAYQSRPRRWMPGHTDAGIV